MATTKKLTMRYWDSLSDDSRFRALRKVFSNFPDNVNRDYAQDKAKELDDWIWKILVRHVKQPLGNTFYKTYIDRTFIP